MAPKGHNPSLPCDRALKVTRRMAIGHQADFDPAGVGTDQRLPQLNQGAGPTARRRTQWTLRESPALTRN